MSLRDTRAANAMPDNASLGAYREGAALLQARRESGGHMRFPDHASYLRYQRGRAQVQLRQQFRAAQAAPAPSPGPTVPTGNLYLAPITNNNVTITNEQIPFSGVNSYKFDETLNSYLSLPGDDSWVFGTGAFTIEWFQYQTDSNRFPRIFAIGSYDISTVLGCSIEKSGDPQDESGILYTWLFNTNAYNATDVEPYKNAWHHFAIVRDSSSKLSLFKDGILIAGPTPNITNNINNNSLPLYFGIETPTDSDTSFGGYLTNIRIVKGLAVYTDNFTVPTSALTVTATANPYGTSGGTGAQAIPDGYTKLLFVP